MASSRSRAVLDVLPVRLCSVRSLDFAKKAISGAQQDAGIASLAAEQDLQLTYLAVKALARPYRCPNNRELSEKLAGALRLNALDQISGTAHSVTAAALALRDLGDSLLVSVPISP